MKVVLVGQPNCGKSTVFNAVAGYKSATANFPGSSVSFTSSRVLVGTREIEVVDLPGVYSLTSQDEAEREAQAYLYAGDASVLVNVVDASRLGRSLELTLQLLELGRPLVVALNMADEAERKGIEIDREALAARLGVPVVTTIARRGIGLVELFEAALGEAVAGRVPQPLPHDREVEEAVREVAAALDGVPLEPAGRPRFAALKLLEADPRACAALSRNAPHLVPCVERAACRLAEQHGWAADQVVHGSRHAVAHALEESAVRFARRRTGRRERIDLFLMHPLFGLPLLLGVLALFFWIVFGVGQYVEAPLVKAFDALGAAVAARIPPTSAGGAIVQGLVLGCSGGFGIVLPYLLPFLFGLAVLEDSGYLPRMAYLLDGVMHRLGLHGKSIVPLMLGYGCSVPAVMATRILESRRDRRITATLAVLIPCSARSTVILGLVGALLGPLAALSVYGVNLLVTAGLAVLMEKKMGGQSPGLILEVPDLRAPSLKTIGARTWLAMKEFVGIAWPLLIVSSILLSLLQLGGIDHAINGALAPLTVTLLGLPAAVGVTLVFGVMRKELSLMMLIQALGTAELARVLAPSQTLAFALFVVFYIPCVATLAVLWRELGWRDTAWIGGLTVVLATVVALAGRFAGAAIF